MQRKVKAYSKVLVRPTVAHFIHLESLYISLMNGDTPILNHENKL